TESLLSSDLLGVSREVTLVSPLGLAEACPIGRVDTNDIPSGDFNERRPHCLGVEHGSGDGANDLTRLEARAEEAAKASFEYGLERRFYASEYRHPHAPLGLGSGASLGL